MTLPRDRAHQCLLKFMSSVKKQAQTRKDKVMLKNESAHQRLWTKLILIFGCFLVIAAPSQGQSGPIDPSGHWEGQHGPLALMLAENTLYFSYSAIFGETAHTCEGVGMATLVDDNLYHHVDEMGTVAFILTEQGVQMNTINGVAPFCGAYWPGDSFVLESFKPTQLCRVTMPQTYFHEVVLGAPAQLTTFVVENDLVEVVSENYNLGQNWVLARFQTAQTTIVGLMKKDNLEYVDVAK